MKHLTPRRALEKDRTHALRWQTAPDFERSPGSANGSRTRPTRLYNLFPRDPAKTFLTPMRFLSLESHRMSKENIRTSSLFGMGLARSKCPALGVRTWTSHVFQATAARCFSHDTFRLLCLSLWLRRPAVKRLHSQLSSRNEAASKQLIDKLHQRPRDSEVLHVRRAWVKRVVFSGIRQR